MINLKVLLQNVGEGMLESLQDFNNFALITPFFGSTY